MKGKPDFVKEYQSPENKLEFFLKMPYANDSVLNPEIVSQFKDRTVEKVLLVYSDFQISPNFQQPELNRKRWEQLLKIAPFLFKNSTIEWGFIAQTKCKTQECAKKLNHGIAVICSYPIKRSEDELELLKKYSTYTENRCDTTYRYRKKNSSFYQPVSIKKQERGKKFNKKSIWGRKYVRNIDTISAKMNIKCYDVTKINVDKGQITDATVINTLMKKADDWKDFAIVADVTGSMSDYYLQILIWMNEVENHPNLKHVTLFNDGDATPDFKKVVMKTGGIYHIQGHDLGKVNETLVRAVSKGNGGDIEENDIEAIVETIKKSPNLKQIVLIADNQANMRDYSFVKNIKIPIRVILCGQGAINSQYLDLVYHTKGSLYYNGEEVDGLHYLKENDTFEFDDNLYQFMKGKFERIYDFEKTLSIPTK